MFCEHSQRLQGIGLLLSHFFNQDSSGPSRLVRFIVIGVSTAAIYWCASYSLAVLTELSLYSASLFGLLAAVSFQYIGHSAYTYRRSIFDRAQAIKFFTVIILGWIVSNCMIALSKALHFPNWIVLAAIMVVFPVVNWVAFETWVYAARKVCNFRRG